jgi:hypothetical protein
MAPAFLGHKSGVAMGFAAGSVSFARFAVVGEHPREIDQSILEKLSEFVLENGEFGVPDDVEYGWCGGRHILDRHFTFEHNVFADALHFAIRIDTNRVPSELKAAYQAIEEEAIAASNPSGFISKNQKRDVKESVRRKLESELREGKFRRSKLIPILWDFQTQTLLTSAANTSAEKLHELFERTFGLTLEPLTAGTLAQRHLAEKGKRRDYEDARPTRFVHGPEGESQWPDYPWTAKGDQPKDYMGNEFLLWLWHEVDHHHGAIKTENGEMALWIDHTLQLDCAYGQSGKDTLRATGPTRMPEAAEALRTGKLPRRCGLNLESAGKQIQLFFNPETFTCSGVRLPDVEDADNPRVVFEERIAMLRDLSRSLDALYQAFLNSRAGSPWESRTATIRRWIQSSLKETRLERRQIETEPSTTA